MMLCGGGAVDRSPVDDLAALCQAAGQVMPKYDFNYHPRQVGVLNQTGQVGYTYHPRELCLWVRLINITLDCHFEQVCVGVRLFEYDFELPF